ncbi:MAG: EF-hand domain-containing protein [Geminicoccaceae bacterium]
MMKTRAKVMLAAGAIALGTTAAVGDSLADGRGGARGGHGERLFEQFDANQDGTITQVEIDEVRSSRLAAFDEDGDGSLTLQEYQALWLDAMRERMVDQFQAHDDDGDGLVTVEEFGERYGSMVRRLDRNDDGEITQDDLRRRPRDRDRDGDDD